MSEYTELYINLAVVGKASVGKTSVIKFLSEYYHAENGKIIIKDEVKKIIYIVILSDNCIKNDTYGVIILCDIFNPPQYIDIFLIMAQNYQLCYYMMMTKMDLIAGDNNFNYAPLDEISKLFSRKNVFGISIVNDKYCCCSPDILIKRIIDIYVMKNFPLIYNGRMNESIEA